MVPDLYLSKRSTALSLSATDNDTGLAPSLLLSPSPLCSFLPIAFPRLLSISHAALCCLSVALPPNTATQPASPPTQPAAPLSPLSLQSSAQSSIRRASSVGWAGLGWHTGKHVRHHSSTGQPHSNHPGGVRSQLSEISAHPAPLSLSLPPTSPLLLSAELRR
jgi:hypothetical protein